MITQLTILKLILKKKGYICSLKEKAYEMSFVCEAEKSEMKVCLYLCTMWKAHRGLLNGTVERLGPITFRLTNPESTNVLRR